jgi:GDPmannose 4,6-dehydratase
VKTALICGVFGQDGSYLAELLLAKGYRVFGTSRMPAGSGRADAHARIAEGVDVLTMVPSDYPSVHAAVVRSEPDEIYALAGQSSVGLSFDEPAATLESITLGTLHLLESVRSISPKIRLFHASSAETFGQLEGIAATESTAFRPCSPYGIAKAAAHMLVSNYREAYGIFAANGLLFNHESPRRPPRFVTRKVTMAADRIARGSGEKLHLGRLDIVRDWGWAPEYVEAMWRMLQQDRPGDYVLATGDSCALSEFVAAAFGAFDLDWREHVVSVPELNRPYDIDWSGADPSRAESELGWRAQTRMPDVARRMAQAEAARQ